MKNEEKTNSTSFINIFTLTVLILSLILIMTGITYAIYTNFLKGTTSNVITTGTITFTYTEGDFIGNGIKIVNAYPTPDANGKIQFGKNNYFDFKVTGTTTISDINYEIVVVKDEGSTLPDDSVKIYLTEITSNSEVPSDLIDNNGIVKSYEELIDSTKQEGKIVYLGTVENNTIGFSKDFRLRMWISDEYEADLIKGKQFSVKVNVLAN